jgi:hypothetical protein
VINIPIIDDSMINNGRKGYFGMFRNKIDKDRCKTFADLGIPLIPERDWDDIIRQKEKDGANIVNLCKEFKLPCKDQGSTNYCWVNAPTHCCEIIRLMESGQVVSLSPASAGAPIKSFSNSGGWGSQALEFFKLHGLNASSDWPDNAIQRSYYTEANKEKAKRNIVREYYILNSWEERGSCILQDIPTADGYDWWRHEVTGVGIVLTSHDLVIRNSWSMSWGDQGFGILSGNKKQSDDSVAILTMEPK